MKTKEKALEWWDSISNEDKTIHCLNNYDGRRHSSLTNRDIEGIWRILGKPIFNETLNSFCCTCGMCDHTSSDCPHTSINTEELISDTNENLANAGAIG